MSTDVAGPGDHEVPGERLVPSDGGPNWMGWFRVPGPPPLELPSHGGTYVLDDGPEGLRYVFVDDE